jgi:A/G-specific adenine glycosylase
MELGATICSPTSPRCAECPLAKRCQALAQGIERQLPELAKRKAPTELATAAAYVRRGDRVLLRQMPADAPRWAGLWVLPFVELESEETPRQGAERALASVALEGSAKSVLREARHTITRFRITLSVVECTLSTQTAKLFSAQEVARLALPSVHARLLDALW